MSYTLHRSLHAISFASPRKARLFPAYPPYGGAHKDVVPHITVARGDEATLAHVERELVAALGDGSVAAACAAFVLIENSTGLWKTMHTFELGAG